MIIDTHIHLDDIRYNEDLDEVIQRAYIAGVERFIIPGADPKTLQRAVEISQKYEHVYFAIGVHPYDMHSFDELDFEHYIHHEKCIAIGECGLDYYRLDGTQENQEAEKKKQKEVFIAQIKLANKYKKPLIIHIRDASRDSKDILMKYANPDLGGVLHCYNADEELLSLSQRGFYFGIGGVVTFKNAKKLVNVLPKIPLSKIVVETDGPYLTPTPHRGQRNEPAYTTFIVEKIAEILNKSEEEIQSIGTKNALNLFNIS